MPNLVSGAVRQGLYTHIVGRRILYHPLLGSTMDEATRLAVDGADEGTVVIAERQSAGRGRQGRSWVSQPGNLLFSVLFRPTMEQLPLVSIIGSLATARAVRKVAGVDPAIKWPNDIMLNGRKAAGILAESAVEGDSVCYAVLGIGINVALNPSDDDEISAIAISVNEAAGTEVARESLLRQLLLELDDLYRRLRTGGSDAGRSPIDEWSGLLETIGNTVTATFRNESISGDAIGVDSAGNLLLRTETGETITLTAGDVTLSAHLRQSRSGSHST